MTGYQSSGIGGLLAAVIVPPLGRFGQFCLVVLALSIIANNCPTSTLFRSRSNSSRRSLSVYPVSSGHLSELLYTVQLLSQGTATLSPFWEFHVVDCILVGHIWRLVLSTSFWSDNSWLIGFQVSLFLSTSSTSAVSAVTILASTWTPRNCLQESQQLLLLPSVLWERFWAWRKFGLLDPLGSSVEHSMVVILALSWLSLSLPLRIVLWDIWEEVLRPLKVWNIVFEKMLELWIVFGILKIGLCDLYHLSAMLELRRIFSTIVRCS